MAYNTPILFLTFKRLDTTKKVFERIREQQPSYLFIASDGPRKGNESDFDDIIRVRTYLNSKIDWKCEVKTLYQEENLGCGIGPYTAITWFFSHVSQGIILEDDCMPYGDFFTFCEQMLDYYKDSTQVMEISGTSLQKRNKPGDASYYFSKYGGIWGWASWARAWKSYDYEMKGYKDFRDQNAISHVFESKNQQKYWIKTFDWASTLGTWWDYQWKFSIWLKKGICIVPNINLIRNIGFNSYGTHTLVEPSWYKTLTAGNGNLGELVHPKFIIVDVEADNFFFNIGYKLPSLLNRAIKRILKNANFLKIFKTL